ncbi:MAG: exopolysaccharide biosynthesis polyprenyl glycosylphosphotransferase [Deltaproteobacteria bacterium]
MGIMWQENGIVEEVAKKVSIWPYTALLGDAAIISLLALLGFYDFKNPSAHALFYTGIFIFLMFAFSFYNPSLLNVSKKRSEIITNLAVLSLIMMLYPFGIGARNISIPYLGFFLIPPALLAWRVSILPRLLRPKRVIVLGAGTEARVIIAALEENPLFECVANISQEELRGVMGLPQPEYWQEKKIDKVIIAINERRGVLPLQTLLSYRLSGIDIQTASDFFERSLGKIKLRDFRPMDVILSEGFGETRISLVIKRLIDIFIALFGLIVLSPAIVLLIILIKLESRGPVIFKQVRLGQGGGSFTMYKFRSMYIDAEKDGAKWARRGDSRITLVGRIIRPLHIDEMPQLWNILTGEMSFIGPRPERPEFVSELEKEVPYYKLRLLFKPGITGWAQVNYGYGNSVEDAFEKMQYDFYYIKNWSLALDLLILVKTINSLKGQEAC